MKKIICLLLAILTAALFAAAGTVAVSAYRSGDFTFTVSQGEAPITGYTGQGGDVDVPDTIEGYPVTGIGEDAFNGCGSLTGVSIPDSVTAVGSYAFDHCTALLNVAIPDPIAIIEEGAFAGCTSLTDVTLPASLTRIESNLFMDCTSLETVTVPASVTSVGANAFYGCTSLGGIIYGGTREAWGAAGAVIPAGCTVRCVDGTIADPPHIPGDITGNGFVGATDLVRFMKYLSDPTVEVNAAALDVNGDGVVNAKDLVRLMKYLSGAQVEIF